MADTASVQVEHLSSGQELTSSPGYRVDRICTHAESVDEGVPEGKVRVFLKGATDSTFVDYSEGERVEVRTGRASTMVYVVIATHTDNVETLTKVVRVRWKVVRVRWVEETAKDDVQLLTDAGLDATYYAHAVC